MDDQDEVVCPVCGGQLDLREQNAGGLVKCGECLQWVTPEQPGV